MNAEYRNHAKSWGPVYAILAVMGGGGGVAAFTDNLPVTRSELKHHQSTTHTATTEELNAIHRQLDVVHLEQVRNQLRQAYSDKCIASGDALAYIEREMNRLRDTYHRITGREYSPPPCIS